MSATNDSSTDQGSVDSLALTTDARGVSWPPDATFWSKFDELTANGHRPHLFRGLLPAEFPGPGEIDELLRKQHAEPGGRHLRVYLGSELRPDISEHFHASPLPYGESPFSSIQRAAGAERVGIVLNQMQSWSEAFLRATGTFLESMYSRRGFPPGGAELVLFAGNYAGTGFGAHRGYEHAFLLHVGPGTKLFHLWPEERYARLTGGLLDVPDYEPLLPKADTVTLRPGDALYLPALCFHIGTQETYSASVALSLYDYTPEAWLARQCGVLSRKLTQQAFLIDEAGGVGHPDRASKYLPPTTDGNPFAAFAARAVALATESIIPAMVESHWLQLRSNAGFALSPKPGAASALELRPETAVRLVAPFQCCWSNAKGERRTIYLRGRRLTLRDHPALPRLLQRLNTHEEVSLREASNLLEERWSNDALEGFFQALCQTGGLEAA